MSDEITDAQQTLSNAASIANAIGGHIPAPAGTTVWEVTTTATGRKLPLGLYTSKEAALQAIKNFLLGFYEQANRANEPEPKKWAWTTEGEPGNIADPHQIWYREHKLLWLNEHTLEELYAAVYGIFHIREQTIQAPPVESKWAAAHNRNYWEAIRTGKVINPQTNTP